jgi:GH24 family phage-related lysozyme (muramidase)
MTRIESSQNTAAGLPPTAAETTAGTSAAPQVASSTTTPASGQTAAAPDLPSPQRTPAGRVDVEALRRDLLRWEGNCRHMYRDSEGFVTTGIGHLLRTADEAVKLPWVHASTGQPASPSEVRAAFAGVAGMPTGHKAPYYERGSDLRLSPDVVRDLADRRLEREFLPGIRRHFPHFDSYPAPAQSALVDMAYNLGVAGLGNFKKLIAACERGDFATAATESHRKSCRDDRNDATHALFVDAASLSRTIRARLTELHP